MSTGAILNQGRLTANTYTTIVTASNTRGDFNFTTHVVDTYTNCLAEEVRADCSHWAKAHTAYYQKNLEACLATLKEYDFQTLDFQLIGRVLAAQAYFDLYLSDASYQFYLINFLDTFEKWLNREKVWSTSSKTAFVRFVQTCRTLARYHAGADPNPKKVEGLLEREQNIQALNWLMQKKEEVLGLKAKRPPKR